MEINKIYNEDCLEGMKRIEDKSIDMILCDLPYGTTKCSWDTIIPFEPLWEQYNRVIKDEGAIVLFGSQPFTTLLISSNIKMFREEIIWIKNKSGSGMQSKQKHIKIHENICIFSKSGNYKYNPQKWIVEEKQFLTQRKTLSMYGAGNTIYTGFERQRKVDDGTRNPISAIAYAVPHNMSRTKSYDSNIDIRLHPTQKPIKLIEYLIKTYTNEGELVLDNCMGSGTTALGCVNTNRNYIGFEIEKKYCDIIEERLR